MPSSTKRQQRTAGMALAVKRGEIPASKARGPVRRMLSMSEGQLHEFASSIKKPRKKAKAKK